MRAASRPRCSMTGLTGRRIGRNHGDSASNFAPPSPIIARRAALSYPRGCALGCLALFDLVDPSQVSRPSFPAKIRCPPPHTHGVGRGRRLRARRGRAGFFALRCVPCVPNCRKAMGALDRCRRSWLGRAAQTEPFEKGSPVHVPWSSPVEGP